MSDIEHGGCACGTVRYTLKAGMRLNPYACHCHECQRRTGSAFSTHMLVAEGDLEVTGETDTGMLTQPSGAISTIYGCAVCRSPIYATNHTRPGFATLRVGSLENAGDFPPAAHLWVGSKQPWVALPDDVPQLEEQPRETAEWMQLLGPK